MYTSLTNSHLPRATSPSMIDGYLAAAASGPNFVMPDQVLRWVWPSGQPADQAVATLIIQHHQAVNDALNDHTYVPNLADPQAWCQGYMAGVNADMMAWAPLAAAQPALLKAIMAGAGAGHPAEAARRIYAFWVANRLTNGTDLTGVLGQLAALAPGHAVRSNQPLH